MTETDRPRCGTMLREQKRPCRQFVQHEGDKCCNHQEHEVDASGSRLPQPMDGRLDGQPIRAKVVLLRGSIYGYREKPPVLIDLPRNATFRLLGEAIRDAWGFDDDHFAEFHLPRTKVGPRATEPGRQSVTVFTSLPGYPTNLDDWLSEWEFHFDHIDDSINNKEHRVELGDMLRTGDRFFYRFDYGDEWWWRVEVECLPRDPVNGFELDHEFRRREISEWAAFDEAGNPIVVPLRRTTDDTPATPTAPYLIHTPPGFAPPNQYDEYDTDDE